MARFVKLTTAFKPNRTTWVNLDVVCSMVRLPASQETRFSSPMPEHTALCVDPSGVEPTDILVVETPEDILVLARTGSGAADVAGN